MSDFTTQFSRISHHTVALSATTLFTGSTFTVPGSELIDDTWSIYDLALSEIGVDEFRDKAYIRIGSNIKEITLGTGTTTPNLNQVLIAGNSTGGQGISMDNDQINDTSGNYIDFNSTTGIIITSPNTLEIFTNNPENFIFNNYAFKTILIPAWDLASATPLILSIAHGLSATEWKTIIDLNGFFRNDADTLRFNLGVNVANFGVSLPFIQKWDATNIIIEPGTALTGDLDFDGTGFNRGLLRFQYIPD
jgi:hypothetical protein